MLLAPRKLTSALLGSRPEAYSALLTRWLNPACPSPCLPAGGESSLDSAQLQKLCRDAELLSRQLTATRVDLLFAAAVGKVSDSCRVVGGALLCSASVEAISTCCGPPPTPSAPPTYCRAPAA